MADAVRFLGHQDIDQVDGYVGQDEGADDGARTRNGKGRFVMPIVVAVVHAHVGLSSNAR